ATIPKSTALQRFSVNHNRILHGDCPMITAASYYNMTYVYLVARSERGARGEGLRILPDGSLSTAEPGEAILPNDPDERLAVARRIVADRCLYGVDKNPMAVEMAKLSLWLITLQKNRPFTFLDHALRCGDSLLGVTSREQIEFLHLNPDKEAVQLRTVSEIWRPLLAQAIAKRKELESFTVNDIQDLARKEALQAEAEALTRNIKIAADYLIGEALAQAGKTGNLKVEDLGVLSGLVTDALEEPDEQQRENKLRQIREKAQRMLNAGKPEGQPPREPFHWALEFPEVFLDALDSNPFPMGSGGGGGFSAIVGNPPFQGGKKITGTVGTDYRTFLVEYLAKGARGNADLCSYFFLNAGNLLAKEGNFGLVATNTISQGDTREVGLDQLVAQGYAIPRAVPSRPWPGTAALEVAYVWLYKGDWQQKFVLNENLVEGITAYLTVPGKSLGHPYRLVANENKSFQGSIVLGMGFVLEPKKAQALIDKDPKNKDVLFPYLNGQDLNSNPDQSPSRWVINFFDWPLDADHDDPKSPKGAPYAADYPDCLAIIEEKVKPERTRKKENGEFALRKPLPQKWWIYADKRPALYGAIAECDRILVFAQTSKTKYPAFSKTGIVFDQKAIVIASQEISWFALLCSHIHYFWAITYGSTRTADPVYTPSDVFETFPFPENIDTLESIGETYYAHRQTIMQTRQEGLTKTYDRFHDPTCTDPDIQTLRHLHIQMDTAVAAAYGWHDLPLNHDFHDTKQGLRFTISESDRREVLDRLLALNHHRYAEEVAQGLHDKKKAKGKKNNTGKKKSQPSDSIQTRLF
ncbi:Eco57I restriction-modification methylase domain-containing protein, partial [Nodosilinea sp. AN01ver1]|uniref:Eco57I restriction-modification methylase domain-containing protein n=1 Tax=Nodosilinea sp. AN01ver1 TaxID=3423362 RepID=UPI003D31BAEC